MKIAVVKYNAGNIFSVMNALRRLGVEPLLTDNADELRNADRVIFPGQGEASTAMAYLREHGLDEVIRSLKQPVLGICIGQQLLCRHSEEGNTDCLGIFDAEVKRFLGEIRRYNPKAKIIWTWGMIPIDIVPALIQQGIKEYIKDSSDTNVFPLELEGMDKLEKTDEEKGSRCHPGPLTHKKAAERIYDFIKNL